MKNNVAVANFNVTYGKKEEPLLKYFERIVYPAFTSGLKEVMVSQTKEEENDSYYFMDVSIADIGEKEYVLTGKLVKETILERKSLVLDNVMQKRNDHYPASPYSVFYIFLRNHRMVLIKNQKGSPDIRSFGLTARNIMKKYVANENKNLPRNEKLPQPYVNVVGIPLRQDIQKELESVKKMIALKLRFYPLNGDLELNDVISGLSKDLRDLVGSKTGNICLNSPESKQGVLELIDAAQGVMEASLDVQYKNNSTGKISNNNTSERISWSMTEDDINDPEKVAPYMLELKSIKTTSNGNNDIYMENIGQIEKFK